MAFTLHIPVTDICYNFNSDLLLLSLFDLIDIFIPYEQFHKVRPKFFYFLFYRFFSQQVRVGGRNKNKIHSNHFPIELKSKETRNRVSFDFNSIGKWSE